MTRRLQIQYDQIAETPPLSPEAVSEDKWHASWSEPVRQKPGLHASLQQAFAIDPRALAIIPFVPIDSWGSAWSEPVRLDKRSPHLYAAAQQAIAPDPLPRPLHPRSYGYILT